MILQLILRPVPKLGGQTRVLRVLAVFAELADRLVKSSALKIALVHRSSPELIMHTFLGCQDVPNIGNGNQNPVRKAEIVDEIRFDYPGVDYRHRDSWIATGYLTPIEYVRKFTLRIAEPPATKSKFLLRLKVLEEDAAGGGETETDRGKRHNSSIAICFGCLEHDR